MSKLLPLAEAFGAPGAPSALSRWFDARLNDAASGFVAVADRLRPLRALVFEEQPDGTFAGAAGVLSLQADSLGLATPQTRRALAGAEVEFRLRPQRCVFRELELPARAADFIEGVVRAQIDRLTPWRAEEAIFGCGAAAARGADRIAVVVAVARRAPLAALLDLGADAVRVTVARAPDAAPITLLAQRAGASSRHARWRVALLATLAFSMLAGVAALAADWTLGAQWRDGADRLTASLAETRAALLRSESAGEDPALQALDARKRATPSAVVVLEALSRALPDDAYLTEMQLQGDKLEISGLATDAAALVKQIEQSPHFARATFTAPTTRGAEERETFRLAAEVKPLNRISP